VLAALRVLCCPGPFAALQVLVFVPFIQWYVFSKLVPTCECCEWFMDTGKNLSATYPPLPSGCEVFKREGLINEAAGTFHEPTSCNCTWQARAVPYVHAKPCRTYYCVSRSLMTPGCGVVVVA